MEVRWRMIWARRLGWLAARLLFVGAITALLVALPDPAPDETLHFKNAVVVLVSIVVAGKLLYDTFFYDRYQN